MCVFYVSCLYQIRFEMLENINIRHLVLTDIAAAKHLLANLFQVVIASLHCCEVGTAGSEL